MKFLDITRVKGDVLNELLVVLGGVALLFGGSQVEIPLKPVPINLMTVAVMLIGLTYTPRKAIESLLIWIGLGAVGFPVFSGFGGGIHHLMGPTAGYIAGCTLAAFLMATLKEKFTLNSLVFDALLCLLGTSLVFLLGVAWLSNLIGFEGAVVHGFLPFILPGFLKAGLLCAGLQIIRYYRRG